MDHGSFDRLTRLLGSAGSRRAALSALAGAGLAGTLGIAGAAKNKKDRSKKRKDSKKSKGGKKSNKAAGVSAQAADCLSPGPSSNMNGCNFDDADFSGKDLSSSSMRETSFRGANLQCADLSSSQLRRADFRGSAGNHTILFGADLSSSGCSGIRTNQFTRFCGTIMCDGSIRNDDCPPGFDPSGGFCDRQPRETCIDAGQCEDDGSGTTRCEVIPFPACGPLVPVCCRETGGSCTNGCDCCGSDECFGGVCTVN